MKAIDIYRRMLDLEMDQSQRARALNKLGHAFVELAGQAHPQENLHSALEAYREALQLTSAGDLPVQYATIQNSLGKAHQALARLLDRSTNLELAKSAFQEALLAVSDIPESRELQASVQVNLGDVCSSLAEAGEDLEDCRRAVEAYQEALKVRGAKSHSREWAAVQSRLGAAYRRLGEREDKEVNCRKAIEACREALTVHTGERFPEEHSLDQIRLGNAHLALSEAQDAQENCRQAIQAYQTALAGPTLSPGEYAAVQNNLGIACTALAEADGDGEGEEAKEEEEGRRAAARRATAACLEALRFRGPASLARASSENNLGNAYLAMARSFSGSDQSVREEAASPAEGTEAGQEVPAGETAGNRKALVQQALAAYQRALAVPALRDQPSQYAAALSNLGEAQLALAEEEESPEGQRDLCKRAIQALEEAGTIYSPRSDLDRARVAEKLCLAYLILAGVESRAWCCSRALKAGEDALEVRRAWEGAGHSARAASLHKLMAMAYNLLADDIRGPDRAEYYAQGAKACREALQVYTRERHKEDYAELQTILCSSLLGLAACGEDAARSGRGAVEACREALQVYSLHDHPLDHALAKRSLAHSLMALAESGEGGGAKLQEAIAAYQEALQVYQPSSFPLERADVEKDLGYAWARLAEQTGDQEGLREALRCYRRALKAYSDLHSGHQFDGLDREGLQERAEGCRRAIRTCKKALKR
ncbi:MAG: hypothetical protein GKC10_05790 [Methanosarcinales archaeon]|nr:hypothetical protein [Methanosarcinales archaeon]